MEQAKLRVAAYCRVSTDREDQANSLRSQQRYFQDYIDAHPGWSLAGVYADEGVSGTSTRRRQAFQRLLRDAENGRLDLILTKEVSRFARNTVDTLEYTRKLLQIGVGVRFLSDHIDTRDNDGELRLTIMASMAQEESRKTSQRVKWGQLRRMEAGVAFGNDSTYGYATQKGRLSIREGEAGVVREVYRRFLQEGKGTYVIARELNEEGVQPPRAAAWSSTMVLRLLRNEKYVGDLLQKKYITTDYLTHRKVENRGMEEQIYLRDHHPAIVERPVWEAVQAELARRAAARGEGSRYSGRYWCSGKLTCGLCGGRLTSRIRRRRDGSAVHTWTCGGRTGEERCTLAPVEHEMLTACAAQALGERPAPPEEDAAGHLAERRARLVARRTRAVDAYLAGAITREELALAREKYERELTRLDKRAAQPSAAPAARERELAAAVERAVVYPDRLELRLWGRRDPIVLPRPGCYR